MSFPIQCKQNFRFFVRFVEIFKILLWENRKSYVLDKILDKNGLTQREFVCMNIKPKTLIMDTETN